jgi:hypothetical protein
MRKVMTSLAVLALVACNKPADTTTTENVAEANVAAGANAAEAGRPAPFEIAGTSWQFTRNDKATTETIDPAGAYVAWTGTEHIDHGTAVMKDGKACFTSAMDEEGEVCWTTSPVEVGQSMETTSDKGEKLSVTRVAYMEVPEAVKPK